MIDVDLKNKFSLRLKSNKCVSEPPLSTILGNMGIITSKFIDEFNLYTKNLPSYFFFEVEISIYFDKSFTFIIKDLTIYFLLKRLLKKRELFLKHLDKFKPSLVNTITLENIYYISLFKFGSYDDNCLKSILGFINSMSIYIVK